MYQVHFLLQPKNDFSLAAAAKRLGERFPGYSVANADGVVTLATDDWEIHLQVASGPEVLADSQRIAELVTGGEDEMGIGAIDRRVEVASDVPDPFMAHFDDYLRVVETMQTFQGVIGVDPKEPSLL